MKIMAVLRVLALLASLAPLPAAAQPYEFVAVYKSRTGQKEKDLTIHLRDRTTLPGRTYDHVLDHFGVQFPEENLLEGDKYSIDTFVFQHFPESNDPKEWSRKSIPSDKASKEVTKLFDYTSIDGNSPVIAMNLVIRAAYRASYLCSQERALRKETGEKLYDNKLYQIIKFKNIMDAMDNNVLYSNSNSKEKHAKRPILYSFCRDILTTVDWEELARAAPTHPELLHSLHHTLGGAGLKPSALYEEHKRRLVDLLVPRLPSLGFGDKAMIVPQSDSGDQDSSLLELSGRVRVAIVKEPDALFQLKERTSGGERLDLRGYVDQKSQIILYKSEDYNAAIAGNLLNGFPNFLDLLDVKFVTNDDKGNELPKKVGVAQNQPRDRYLKIFLVDFLEKRVTIKIYMKLRDGKPELILQSDPFVVKRLGWITTFPGATEISTLINKYNAKDLVATSTIPVSWAVNLSGNRVNVSNIAITLPWILSYSSRRLPDFPKYFAVFPHASLLVASGASGPASSTRLAFAAGVGVSLAQAFQFAWAVSHTGEQYVMVGLSIPGLAKLAW